MPTAILSFNLPEEQDEFEITMRAHDYHCALWEIRAHIRSMRKGYAEKADVEDLWETFHRILKENNITDV